MHDAVQIEHNGVPTVTLVHDRFHTAAKAQAKAHGLPDLPMVVMDQRTYWHGTDEELQKAADALYPQVIERLTTRLNEGAAKDG